MAKNPQAKSHHPHHRLWLNVRQRCRYTGAPNYKYYGGRGIDMHDAWYDCFETFAAAIGWPPKDGRKYELDRIDNNLGYVPGNVQWLTHTDNCRKRRYTPRVKISQADINTMIEMRQAGHTLVEIAHAVDRYASVVRGTLIKHGVSKPSKEIGK